MKCLRSWRPSRITEKAAILRATPWALVLLFFIFMSILGAVLSCKWLLNLSCVVSLLSFIGFLNRTLKSDQYYELKKFDQKGTVKLYIYKDNPFDKFYQLYVRTKDETCVYTIDKYEFFKIGKRRDWFIFAAKDDWYCQYFDTIVPLGKRLGQSVFIDKNKNDTRFRISALSLKNEIKTYMAERYFFGDDEIYIPELFDNKDHHTHYILIKENQSYKLISSSEICKKKRKMMLAGIEKYRSVIFKEDEETIILVWNENQKEYQEIYRGINDVPSLKCFLKLENSKLPSYGVVSKFDKRKKELTPIYEGEITFIDESQRIILGKGDDDLYPY
jgi:hypothetical protein